MTKVNKIGIIAAMQIELDNIKSSIKNPVTTTVSGMEFISGTLHGKEIVAVKCGIGKVFAAACTQTMILKFAPDCIINTGVAGGLNASLSIGDVVIGTKTVQHDMDTSPLGDEVGMVSGINIVYFPSDDIITKALVKSARDESINCITGIIACGDKFIADSEDKKNIISQFSASACDMESAAIAHVCYINSVPFGVLRAISDTAGGEAHMDFNTFLSYSAERSTRLTDRFISII